MGVFAFLNEEYATVRYLLEPAGLQADRDRAVSRPKQSSTLLSGIATRTRLATSSASRIPLFCVLLCPSPR
jgi:hypothetical protein